MKLKVQRHAGIGCCLAFPNRTADTEKATTLLCKIQESEKRGYLRIATYAFLEQLAKVFGIVPALVQLFHERTAKKKPQFCTDVSQQAVCTVFRKTCLGVAKPYSATQLLLSVPFVDLHDVAEHDTFLSFVGNWQASLQDLGHVTFDDGFQVDDILAFGFEQLLRKQTTTMLISDDDFFWVISSPPRALLPRNPPRTKSGRENKWMNYIRLLGLLLCGHFSKFRTENSGDEFTKRTTRWLAQKTYKRTFLITQ